MDHAEVGRFWNENADTWTRLARAGFDVYRDHLNTPAFFGMLPDAGFVVERLGEPRPTDDAVRVRPDIQDAQVVAYFLHIRVRKPL